MSKNTFLQSNPNMVNYTTVLTSAPDEIYVSKTESPDSLASLMKNTITIQFSLTPHEEKKIDKKENKTTSAVDF